MTIRAIPVVPGHLSPSSTACSAPSVALGSKSGETRLGSFHVYGLAPGADGGVRLVTSEQVMVA